MSNKPVIRGKISDKIVEADRVKETNTKKSKNDGGVIGGIGYTLGNVGTGFASVFENVGDAVVGGVQMLTGDDRGAAYTYGRSTVGDWNKSLDNWYNPSKFMKGVGDVAGGVGQSVAYVGTSLIPVAGPTLSLATMGLSGYGGGVSSAYEKTGKLGGKEVAYGALSAATEIALEKFLGSTLTAGSRIAGKGATSVLGKSLAKGATRKGAVSTIFTEAAEEGLEEFVSSYTDTWWLNATGVDKNASTSFSDALYNSMIGFVSGGIMSGASVGIRNLKNESRGARIIENGNEKTLLNTGKYVRDTLGLDNLSKDSKVVKRLSDDLLQLNNSIKAYEALADDKKSGAKGKLYLGEIQESVMMVEAKAKAYAYAEEFDKKIAANPALAEKYAKTVSTITGLNITAEDIKNNKTVIGTFGARDVLGMTKLVGEYVAEKKAIYEEDQRIKEEAISMTNVGANKSVESSVIDLNSEEVPFFMSDTTTAEAPAQESAENAPKANEEQGPIENVKKEKETPKTAVQGKEGNAEAAENDKSEKSTKEKAEEKKKEPKKVASEKKKAEEKKEEKKSANKSKEREEKTSAEQSNSGGEDVKRSLSESNSTQNTTTESTTSDTPYSGDAYEKATKEAVLEIDNFLDLPADVRHNITVMYMDGASYKSSVGKKTKKALASIMAIRPDLHVYFTDRIADNGSYIITEGGERAILVNAESGVVGKTIIHEVTHALKVEGSEAYKALEKQALSIVPAEERAKVADAYMIRHLIDLGVIDADMSVEEAREIFKAMPEEVKESVANIVDDEITANFVASALSNKRFLEKYGKTHRNAIARAIAQVRKLGASLIHRSEADKVTREIERNFASAAGLSSIKNKIPSFVEPVEGEENAYRINWSLASYENDAENRFSGAKRKSGRRILYDFLAKQYGKGDADQVVDHMDAIVRAMRDIEKDNPNLSVFGQWNETELLLDDLGHPIFSVSVKNGDYVLNIDMSRVCKKRRQLDYVLSYLAKRPDFRAEYLSEEDFVKINNVIKKHGYEVACDLCFVDAKRYRQAAWAASFANTWNDILESMVSSGNLTDFDFASGKMPSETDVVLDLNKPITYRKWEKGDAKESKTYKSAADLRANEGNANIKKIVSFLIDHPEARHRFVSKDIIASEGFDAIQRYSTELRKVFDGWGGTSVPKPSAGDTVNDNAILETSAYNPQNAFAMGGVRMNSFSDFMAHMFFDYCQSFAELHAKKLPAQAYTKELIFARLFGLTGMKINLSGIPAIRKNAMDSGSAKGKEKEKIEAYEKRIAGLNVDRLAEHLGKSADSLTFKEVIDHLDLCDYNWSNESIDMKKAALLQSGIMYDKIIDQSVVDRCYDLVREGKFEEAYELAGEECVNEGYANNVGTIVVGVSEAHIRKLLRDNTVRMVIPYHRSGLNAIVAKAMNISYYNDFTNKQTTGMLLKGKKVSSGIGSDAVKDAIGGKLRDFDFYEYFGKTVDGKFYDGKATAKKYIEWCEKGAYDKSVGAHVYYTTDGYILASDLHKMGNIVPKFNVFTNEENYYKLLEDFDVYNSVTGKHSAQEAVQFTDGSLPTDYKQVLLQGLEAEQSAYDDFISDFNNEKDVDGIGLGEEIEGIVTNARKKWESRNLRRSIGDRYNYDSLTKKGDLSIVPISNSVPLFEDGHIDRSKVIKAGKENAKKQNNANNTNTETYVRIDDIGVDALIGTKGLQHGLARSEETALAVMRIGDILKNSIAVNELNGSIQRKTDMSYILLGACDIDDDLCVARSVVSKLNNKVTEVEIYQLGAIKGKKIENPNSALKRGAAVTEQSSLISSDSHTISIAEFLEKVKHLSLANEVFSEDVLQKLGVSRANGDVSKSIRYSLSDASNVSSRIVSTADERSTLQKGKDFVTDVRSRTTKENLGMAKTKGQEAAVKVQTLLTNAQAGIESHLRSSGMSADVAATLTDAARKGNQKGDGALMIAQTDISGKIIGKSLRELAAPASKEMDDFKQYWVHKVNAVRAARGKNVFNDIDEATSQKIVSEYEKSKPHFKKALDDVMAFNKNMLQLEVDGGLITQEEMDAYLANNPYYFPVIRVKDTDPSKMKSNAFRVKNLQKSASGGEADIIDPMEAFQDRVRSVYHNVYVNQLANAVYDTADGENVRVASEKIPNFDQEGDDAADKKATMVAKDGIDPKSNTIVFFKDGVATAMSVSNVIMEGFKPFHGGKSFYFETPVGKANTWVMRTFSKLVTTWNPLFIIRNAVRDFQDGGINTRYGFGQFVKAYVRAVREIKAGSDLWLEYVANGGFSASIHEYNLGGADSISKRGLRRGSTTLSKAGQTFENAQLVVEQLPRFAEYILSRDAGNDVSTSLYHSADVTTNFARGGTLTKTLGKTVMPFLNPAFQGLSRTTRLVVEAKHDKRRLKRLVISAAILGIAPIVLFNIMYGDDEDYEILDDNLKTNYYLFKVGDKFIRVPRGRLAASIASVANTTQKQIEDGEFSAGAWWDTVDNVLSQSTPIDNATRTIFSPILDVKTNTTWYGGVIESSAYDHVAPAKRYDEYTSAIAKAIGKALNKSPKKIDYLLDQYTGVIGDFIIPLTADSRKQSSIGETIFASMITDPVYSNKLTSDFYDMYDKADWADDDDLVNYQVKKHLDDVREAVNELNKEIDRINDDDTLSKEEKAIEVRSVRELINQAYKTALQDKDAIKEAAQFTAEAYTDVFTTEKVTESNYRILGLDKDDIGLFAVVYDSGEERYAAQVRDTEEEAEEYLEIAMKRAVYSDMVLQTYGAEAAIKSYSEDFYENKAYVANALGVDYEVIYRLLCETRYMSGKEKKARVNEFLSDYPYTRGIKGLIKYIMGDTTKKTKAAAASALRNAKIDEDLKISLLKKLQ